jgi:Uma2 family endonuclease
MSVARQIDLVDIDTYLSQEAESPTRHEYVGGVVYAMSGGTNRHGQISSNALASLWNLLRGHRCRAYGSDTKIRIRTPRDVRFYYPDATVVCRSNPPEDVFQDEPIVIVEVLSRSTRRIDEGEKRDSYLSIPSLSLYLLVDQESPLVIAHRRTGSGFVREVYKQLDQAIRIEELEISLPLTDIYDGLVFEQ